MEFLRCILGSAVVEAIARQNTNLLQETMKNCVRFASELFPQ